MTPKQALVIRLNELRDQLGWPRMSEKTALRASIGVVRNNVELAEKALEEKDTPQ